MSFVYEFEKYYSFNEYQRLIKDGTFSGLKKGLEFAHPVDSKIIKIIDATSTKNVVNNAVETMVSAQLGLLLSTGITVDSKSFPEQYNVLTYCCETLGISMPHTVITNEMQGINAMATGTDNFSFIAISNLTPKLLSIDEQKFIIAHECGHIALGHVVYHTIGGIIGGMGSLIPLIGPIVANTISMPLNTWSRCSEITADRAGLICCKDLKIAQTALLKIVSGFTEIENVDIDEYIEQSMNSINEHKIGGFKQYLNSHPLIPKRLKALEYFSNSQMYYRSIGKEEPKNKNLYSDKQLNSLVNELMKIM